MALRLIPELDRNPTFVRQAQTTSGKLSILFLFALPLWLLTDYWRQLILVLLILTLLPRFRRQILTFAAPLLLLITPAWMPIDTLSRLAAQEGLPGSFDAALLAKISSAVVFVCLALAARAIFRDPKAWWLKRPLVAWHGIFCLLLVAASTLPLSGLARVMAWAFVFAVSGYFWYFCYTITDRASKDRDPWTLQMGTWRPVWNVGSASTTPFVKGAAYLREIEAKTPNDLAVTQLKGVKLIWWAFILRAVLLGTNTALHGPLAPLPIPSFDEAFAASAGGHPYSAQLCWAIVISGFLESLLNISIWGHQIVACCRMAGFRALRNTWRPLGARTIAEFWNRYYFYFKELLVDLFFYPTFLRYFRRHPRLRRFAATLAAASFGNMLFHFIRDIFYCTEMGLWRAIAGFHVYAFYCLALGTAIGISQIRSRKPEAAQASWLRRRLWPGLCVSGFYCVLHIFDVNGRTYPITQHFRFLFHLFAFGR